MARTIRTATAESTKHIEEQSGRERSTSHTRSPARAAGKFHGLIA